MAWAQVSCQYDGTFAGFLSCVYDCYTNQEEPAEFRTPEDVCCSLYPLRTVETDEEHARRVYRSFAKFGREGRELAAWCFLTCLPDKELWLWRFLCLGWRLGPEIGRCLTDPTVDKVRKAVLHLEREAHLYTGFTRFSELDGVLVGEIEPKNQVLPLLRPHFCGRYSQERFVLHDRAHAQALFHRPGPDGWAILPVEDFRMGPAEGVELAYRKLWRAFYDTIAIEGRYNPKCRMTHMPRRYWAMMTEFQEERDAGSVPQNSITPGGVEADGHQLLVPLDAVDGQLPRRGGGPHGGGVVDHVEHHRRQTEADGRGPPLFFDEEDPDRFPFHNPHSSLL